MIKTIVLKALHFYIPLLSFSHIREFRKKLDSDLRNAAWFSEKKQSISKSRKILKYIAPIVALFLVSCKSSGPRPELRMSKISLYTDADLNQNSATAVDLVIVYNAELTKRLGTLSACTYFASSKQLLLDNPTLLDVWHWELVPGQSVQNFTPPQDKGRAFGAYVFANYLTPGAHRLKVAPDGAVAILLTKDDLKDLSELGAQDIHNGETMIQLEGLFDSSRASGIISVTPQNGPVTTTQVMACPRGESCSLENNDLKRLVRVAESLKKEGVIPAPKRNYKLNKWVKVINSLGEEEIISVSPRRVPSSQEMRQTPIVITPLQPVSQQPSAKYSTTR